MGISTEEYVEYDGLGLAKLIKSGQVTPEEVLAAAIEQIDRVNPKVNSVVYKMYDEAKKTAASVSRATTEEKGMFYGVPFLIKDLLIQYAGQPTTFASRFVKTFIPDENSELMNRYIKSGVVTVGKTNTPEFGLMGITEPELYGPCRSPWDLGRTSGGSSGGAGASVASGMVPIAHGGDGGGSIRIPASACGLVGLKPSSCRMPIAPYEEEGWMGLVSEHVLTKTVRDSAAMLDCTHGFDKQNGKGLYLPSGGFLKSIEEPVKDLKIAFTADSILGVNTHADCVTGLEVALKNLEDLGHTVAEAKPKFDKKKLSRAYLTIVSYSLKNEINSFVERLNKPYDKSQVELASDFLYFLGNQLTPDEVNGAVHTVEILKNDLKDFYSEYDLLVTPTLSNLPSRIGEMELTFFERQAIHLLKSIPIKAILGLVINQMAAVRFEHESSNTQIFNLSGFPAISVPLTWNSQKIPIGIQLGADLGREDLLLNVARQLEVAKPWDEKILSNIRQL